MPLIGSAAGDHVHLAASVPSVLRAITVGGDLEFLDGVHRRLKHEPVHILIVVIHAVQQIIVVLLAAPIGVHGERPAGGEFGVLHRRQYAGGQQRKLQEIALVERQAVDAALVDHRAQLPRFAFERMHNPLHRDRLPPGGERQVKIPSMRASAVAKLRTEQSTVYAAGGRSAK